MWKIKDPELKRKMNQFISDEGIDEVCRNEICEQGRIINEIGTHCPCRAVLLVQGADGESVQFHKVALVVMPQEFDLAHAVAS